MRYFKPKELMLTYNVSEKTIRNWIAAAEAGKLDLKLYEEKGKMHIADSTANNYLLEQLTLNSRKYRNSRNHKTIEPAPEFYELFNPEQIREIAHSLDMYHELSWHYSYFGRAATYWNQYLHELYEAGKPNMITNSIETLDFNMPYIEAIYKNYKHVNIINVCIGNNLVVRKLVGQLKRQDKLGRFVAIDISPDILNIAENNAQKWYNNTVVMEKKQLDVRQHTFGDIITEDTFGDDASETINLIFFIAGPLHNFKDPTHILRMLGNSMNKGDLLFTTVKRDTNETNQFFDFNIKSDPSLLGVRRRMLLELLNIDEAFYETEQLYDEKQRCSFVRVLLKVGLTLNFHAGKFQKTVELRRGDHILLWRGWRYSDRDIVDMFSTNGFSLINVTHSLDEQLTFQISKLSPDLSHQDVGPRFNS